MIDEETKKEIDLLKEKISTLEKRPSLSNHRHDGIDTYQINAKDFKNNPILNVEALTIGSGNSGDFQDMFFSNSVSAAITNGAPKGSPKNGQKLIIRLEDDGTARAITWNAIYRAMGTALPTTTVLGKIMYLGFIYHSADAKWDLVAKADEA